MKLKYNHSYGENGKDFSEYIDYLNSIKEYISIDLYNFISDPNRHDFSNKSLHDSRIEKIQFINDFEKNNSNMVITLLGKGRIFKLDFLSIIKYRIEQLCRINDLLTYEIGLGNLKYERKNILVFRAEFCDGGIEIFCEEIHIKEILE
ncbi:MAG: hypothetical protein FWH43_06685 [Endomicrobia bacterium]|nr:hypothetical protein [Endomicrobiia bacterium]